MSGGVNNAIPDKCEWDDLVKPYKNEEESKKNNWTQKAFGECYKEIEKNLKEKFDEEKKEAIQKALQDKYSGTSVATGSIGAGAGGLACGLGLFPYLVKLVSKFR